MANEKQWTPGPWKALHMDRVTTPDDETGIMSIAHIYNRKGRAIANQSLIAAAPTLYDALERLEDEACDLLAQPDNKDYRKAVREALDAARSALASARAETKP